MPTSKSPLRIAILDDYTSAAQAAADWHALQDVQLSQITPSMMETEAERALALAPYDVLVAMRERTPFPKSLIDQLPNLKLLVTTGMRNFSIDMEAARAKGIDVCGTQMTPYAAFEHSWALLMAHAKQIPAEHHAMVSGGWQAHTGVGLHGKTLGILGLGKIGAKMARAAQAFDMKVIAWSPNLTAQKAQEHGATFVDQEALFKTSDFLTIHMVLSSSTRGLVNEKTLSLMKPTAYLVNTSRGPIIDEKSLINCLENGAISGAALDVYDAEPLPADHPLRKLSNVTLTGHTGYVVQELFQLAYGQAVENIGAWQNGGPLRLLN
ncbi:D-2-hydroxyacid dehydrogenase family protein [uncultured Pelagimonas sp.]|uniref:D-2-hydroxyacid dehydrogenase family protein n=1 Tax=uncultured Pelagimonas sp. TaxID=1618102 RepID=UPI00260E18A5|nr:D-2-hydroxyacid dehydrogenase family protein [uncultured Pelagimonas sp.]